MSDNDRRRRTSRTGALAQILAEEQAFGVGTHDPIAAEAVAGTYADQHTGRYYPTKGRAKIPPQVCLLWKYADRPEAEAGHATEIAASLTEDGQIAPAIVRCIRDPQQPEIRYEIISGQVRWRAALAAGTDLDVDIRQLDDKSAFRLMVRENELRRGLSDYATALRLQRALVDGIYEDRATLARDMRLSAAQVSYYLGFAELPQQVVSRFENVTRIPVRLGYAIGRAIQQGFLEQVLENLKDIETGAIPRDQIPRIWMTSNETPCKVRVTQMRGPARAVRYTRQDGTPLFSVRESGESGPVLRFSKTVGHLLNAEFWAEIQAQVEARLREAQNSSVEK